MPCSVLKFNRRFGGMCYLNLHGRRTCQTGNHLETSWKQKEQERRSSETSVYIHRTTRIVPQEIELPNRIMLSQRLKFSWNLHSSGVQRLLNLALIRMLFYFWSVRNASLSDCMRLSPSWKSINCSVTQQFTIILQKKMVHFYVHKNPPLFAILSQIIAVHTITSCFSEINFIIISYMSPV
jgi:hypothetical protein